MQAFGYGQGGKHRNTEYAARWRKTTAQIAARILASGIITDRTVAMLHAEDELSSAVRKH